MHLYAKPLLFCTLAIVGFSGCSTPVKTSKGVRLNPEVPATASVPKVAVPEPVQSDYSSAQTLRSVGVDSQVEGPWVYRPDDPVHGVTVPVGSSRLRPAVERVIYYGASKQGATLLAPAREYIKVRESSFDENSTVEDAPSGGFSTMVAPAGKPLALQQDPAVTTAFSGLVGRTQMAPVPKKVVLSGSTSPVEGFFQALGFQGDNLPMRREAQAVLDANPSLFPVQGELVYDETLGWGYFVPFNNL